MKIDHINISAPKEVLDRDKDFLCEIFPLKEGFRPNLSHHGYWLYFGDNALFHLSQSDNHHANEKPGYLDHVAFQLGGLAQFVEKLDALDVPYDVKQQSQISITQVFLALPSGLKIEVTFKNETLS